MAKTKRDTTKRAKSTEPMSYTKTGAVPTRKVDSLRKAGYDKAIGAATKDKYGTTRYGDAATDAIRAGLKKKSK